MKHDNDLARKMRGTSRFNPGFEREEFGRRIRQVKKDRNRAFGGKIWAAQLARQKARRATASCTANMLLLCEIMRKAGAP